MSNSTPIKIMLDINKNFKEVIKDHIIINLIKKDGIHMKEEKIIINMGIRWVEGLIMADLGKGIMVDLAEEVLFITGLLPLLQVIGDSMIGNNPEMTWIEIVEEEEEEEDGKKEGREGNIVINKLRYKNKVLIITQEKLK